jgi:hypothetical protein
MSDEEETKLPQNNEESKGGVKHIKKSREDIMKESKEKEEKRLKSMFLGESHGHFKIGTFLRIEL